MAKENLKISNLGTQYYFELIGELDEDTKFLDLYIPEATEITVNFEKVIRLQSCGIREWIQLIRPYNQLPFTFINCPKIVIDQINMTEGFLPKNGLVASFYVPYFNDDSGDEKQVLFTFGIEFDKNSIYPPEDIKDSNGNLMFMDVLEHKYFKFLKNKSEPNKY